MELDLLLEREEPLSWDVENRRMEMDRAVSARNPLPTTGKDQGIRPRHYLKKLVLHFPKRRAKI